MKNLYLKTLVLLLLCMVGANAMAYDIYKDGIYYDVNDEDKTAIVTYNEDNDWDPITYYHSYSGDIVIPSEFSTSPGLVISSNGTNRVQPNTTYTVIGISEWAFKGCKDLTSVIIGNNVTAIEREAFQGCTGLTSVIIGNNVTTIESEAFQGCTGLTSVTIGNSVTSIGYDAFKDCSNISSITFHCKEIGNWFSDWSVRNSVRSVIIGEEVTTIGDYAFNYFGGLTNITIPNSVASIGKYAFHECSGLTSVIIPNGVQAIGENTFSHCSALTSVTIPNSVTSIGKGAFLNCTGLTSITIPNSVIQIGESAFYGCSNLESITIPNSVTSIGSTAFKNCSSLKSINIPNNINEIKYNTFYGCKELERITIPNSITKIGESAFYGCSGLTRVDYSSIEHLCSIEFVNVHSNPLYYARHLYINGEELKDNLVVPESITSIGIGAFNGCILKNVMVKHQTPPTSDAQTFSVQTLYHATLYVPTGTWESYAYDDAWYTFINIRETATETAELSGRHAYTLMDAKSFAYMVYDPVNGGMNSIASTAIDENNPNHCWQTITVDGQRYLYNIGAKKFAQLSPDGKSLTFTENVASIEMTDGEDGLLFGSQQGRQWAMVTNDKTAVDDSVIEGVVTSVAMKNANEKKPQSLSTT